MNPFMFGIVFGVIVGAIVIATVSIIIRLRKKERISRIKEKPMKKEEIINGLIEDFTKNFNETIEEKHYDVPEINDEIIKNVITEYFNKETLTSAEKYMYNVFDEYVKNTYDEINWGLEHEKARKTPEYIAWERHMDISSVWNSARRMTDMMKKWVEVNGMAHTEEEAATIAADKWCELLFEWHLQDNGALNEDHPGGFTACALATVLANGAKDEITEEMQNKAHELFKEYYLRQMHYNRTYSDDDIEWLKNNLPDKDGEFNWDYGFGYELSCDYDPSYPLYLILVNAGIPEKDVRRICPWKTSISIRFEDNTVRYYTYRHCDEF